MTRVLVAAHSAVARAGLEALVGRDGGLVVVGSAAMGGLARRAEELQPDVILLELDADDEDPLPALRGASDGREPAVAAREPALVVLVDDARGAWAADAIRSGVRAVLPREASAEEIVAAVEAAAAGLVVLHGDVAASLLSALPAPARALPAAPDQALTPREIEVLNMLAEGLGNKSIGPRLGISEHTVKFHVASIFSKLHAQSRTEAVTIGARLGLIML